MAGTVAPNISTDGLVLYYDTANTKSYDRSENLALNSEALNLWANNGNAILRTPNVEIAPDGTLTADTLAQTAATGASRWISSTTRTYTAGVTYTLSIWLKRVSGTDGQPSIRLWVNGGMETSIGTITNDWIRYSASFTPSSTISVNTFSGLNTSWGTNGQANNFVFAAWGFQIEVGSSATTYIPTTSTPKLTGTTWIDLSRSNINGTLINGPTYNSSNGGSIVFDGTDDFVGVTNGYTAVMKGNDYWTVSLWFRANNLSNNPVLISPGAGQLNYFDLFLEVGPNSIFFSAGGGSGSNLLQNTSTPLVINTIYNINYIKTGPTTGKVYVNGNEISLTTIGSGLGTMPNSNADFRIGAFKEGSFFLNGNIYNVSMYNRALSATEVLKNYNSTKTRFGL
jgi:hypothetical protein